VVEPVAVVEFAAVLPVAGQFAGIMNIPKTNPAMNGTTENTPKLIYVKNLSVIPYKTADFI